MGGLHSASTGPFTKTFDAIYKSLSPLLMSLRLRYSVGTTRLLAQFLLGISPQRLTPTPNLVFLQTSTTPANHRTIPNSIQLSYLWLERYKLCHSSSNVVFAISMMDLGSCSHAAASTAHRGSSSLPHGHISRRICVRCEWTH
ncbi:hypothetical protein ONS96_000617 [Cadophora gregata f. sp. sojae]|nr:hypothetical protein ONS96_000617 [Cadophora gregata f. sp. sojae]